jgi:nitroreductase
MEKPAPAAYPIDDLIARRWSPRAFESRAVERSKLLSLFEAARWAPSSFNGQPWRFLLATRESPTEFQRMLDCLVEFNQGWAKAAPVLAVAVAALKFEHNGEPNRHAAHDTGMALQNLALQATATGLVVHFMAGFDVDRARQTYNISHEYEPMTAMAIGYPGDPATLAAELRDRERAPRRRRPLCELLFSGTFGEPAPLLG